MKRAYYIVCYYVSWFVFGLVGVLLNLACLPLLLLPRRAALGPVIRRTIRALFDLWARWLHMCGVVEVSWHGFPANPPAGIVYVANHPSLIDATGVLARLPEAVCIFKPALMRNPAIGPAAIMAEYIAGHTGVDSLREAALKVAAGRSLLIFPEGTRTPPDEILGPLKSGFALIAMRAEAPVQLLVIRATPGLVPRHQPWWRLPAELPAHLHVSFDRTWPPDPTRHAADLAREVEQHLRTVLST